MSFSDLEIVIMAGGSGQRFFPLSRENYPKQFVKFDFLNGLSLFQTSFQRALEICNQKNILISTHVNYKYSVMGQIEELGISFDEDQIITEPKRSDTMAAISYAMRRVNDKALFFCSDQYIENNQNFITALKENYHLSDHSLVLFGIEPKYNASTYGYFKLRNDNKIESFIEKPDSNRAQELIDQGFLWNSGMFLLNKKIFLEEIKTQLSDFYNFYNKEELGKEDFLNLDKISFDYALLEKSQRLCGIAVELNWSDIGSLNSLDNFVNKDDKQNIAENDCLYYSAKNNLVSKDKNKLAVLVGVDDLNIIDTKDVILVSKKDTDANKMRTIVNDLKNNHDIRYKFGSLDYRPWGFYEVLEEKPFYKVKRLVIYPGKTLSLQSHQKRNEHWVVVQGKAKVINGDDDILINSNESVYIPAGNKHRLSNPFSENLEVIEVQTGSYLGEDDIQRFDDVYARVN